MSDARAQRGALAVAYAVVAGVSWNITNTGAVADELATAYGVGLASVGLLTSVLFLTQLFTQLPAGRAIDRLGPRPVAAAAIAGTVAGNAVCVLGDGFALALAGRGVTGLAVGIGFLAGARLVQAAGGGVLAQGVYGATGLAGGGLALALVPPLTEALGWQSPYLSALAAALPGLAALALARAPGPVAGASRLPLRALAADGRIRRLAVLHAASFGLGVVIANWVVELLDRRGIGDPLAGVLGGLTLMLGVVSRPAGGLLARRRPEGTDRLLGGAMLLGAAGTALLAATSAPALAAVGAVLVGVAAGLPFGPVLAESAAARPEAPGAAVAAVNTAAVATITAATPLLGLTFGLPGEGRLGFAALAVLWAAAALAAASGRARTTR